MKKTILTAGLLMIIGISAKAQHYKKDGSLDMRYKENKETYQNNFNNNNYYSAPKESAPKNYDNGGQIKMQDGYFKTNGNYVAPHVKTTPDDNKWNNKSNW